MDKAAIGERIRQMRESCKPGSKMSQDELAAAIGMCRNTVVNLENAKNKNLNLDTLERVAQYLGTTEEYLLFGIDTEDYENILCQDELKKKMEIQRLQMVEEYERKIGELQKDLANANKINAAYEDHIRTLKQINERLNKELAEND